MSITIPQIETDAASLFHAALTRAETVLKAIPGAVDTIVTDADKLAAIAKPILAAVAPQDAAALTAVTGILNLVDSTVGAVAADASGGVTVTLPAELVALWKSSKAQLLAFEHSL
jgi:hypothetical protein